MSISPQIVGNFSEIALKGFISDKVMGLPFLIGKDKEASVSAPADSIKRKPDNPDNSEDFDMLEASAEELCSAVKAGDHKAVAQAFRSMFQICDSESQEEMPQQSEGEE